jgi:hypothetical protein
MGDYSMEAKKDPPSGKSDSIDFSYQAETPGPDLLDYRYMAIEMTRLSDPGKIWTTVLAGAVVMGLCVLSIWAERIVSFVLGG